MPVNAVAKNIRKIRKSKNISQENMAKTLNVTRQAISSWENGKTQPDIDMLMNIAKVLDVEMTELIYGQKKANDYDAHKKDRIRNSIILAASLIVLIILKDVIGDYLNQLRIDTFVVRHYFIFMTFAYLLIYLIAGSTVTSVLAIWKDISVSNNKARKFLMILSLAIVWIYLLLIELPFYNDVFTQIYIFVTQNTSIFMIPAGVGLFLALNGDNKKLKNTIITTLAITLCVILIFISHFYR